MTPDDVTLRAVDSDICAGVTLEDVTLALSCCEATSDDDCTVPAADALKFEVNCRVVSLDDVTTGV